MEKESLEILVLIKQLVEDCSLTQLSNLSKLSINRVHKITTALEKEGHITIIRNNFNRVTAYKTH